MSSNNNKKNGNKKNGKNLGKTGGIKLNTTRDSGFSDSLTEDLSAATNRVVARTEHSLTINEPSSSSSQDEATNITLSTKCFADKGKLKKVEEDILIISNSESNSENHQQQQQQQQQGLSDLSANSSSMAIRDATNHDYITIVKTTKVTTKVKHIKETKNKKNKTSKQDETTGAVVEASESSGVSSDLTSTRVCTVAKTSQSSQSILAVNTTSQHHIRGGGSVIGLLEEEVENSSSADEEFSVAAPSLLQVKVNKSTEESVYETSATAPQPQQMIVDLNSTVLDCEDILSTYSTQANRQSTASPKMMLEQQQLKSSTIPKKEETKATTQPEAVAKVAGPQPPQKSAKKRTIFSFFSISKKNNEEEKENKKDKKSKKSKKQIEEQPKLVAEKTEAKEMEIVVDTAAVESKLQSPLASPSNSSFSNMLQFGNQKHELLDPEQKERIIYLKPQCVQFIAQKLLESEPKPKSEEFQKNLSKMIARALDLLGHDRVPSLDYLVNKLNEEYQVEDDQNKDKVNSVQTKDYFNDHFQRFLLNERCLLQLDLDKSQVQPAEEIIQFNADGSKQKPFADLQNEKKEIVIQPQDVNLNIHNLAVIRQNLDLNINDMMMASTTKDEVKPVKGGIDEWNVGLDHTYDPNKPHKPIQMDQSNSPKAADTTKVDITKTKKTKKEKHQEQKTEVVDLPFDAHIVLETVKEPPILFPSDENYKHPEGLFKEVEMVVTKEVDEGPILDKKIEEKIIPKQKKEKKKSKNPLTSCLTCSCASGVTKEEKKKRKQETEPILDKESESDADLAFSVPTATVEMPLFTIDFSNLDAPPKSETEERPKLDEKPVEVKEDYEKQQHDEEVEKTNAQHKVSIVDAVNQLIKTTETQVVTTSEEVEKIRQGDEKQSTVVATTPPATPNVKTEFDEEKYVDPLKNQLNIITPMLKGETETDVIKTQASEVRVADTVDAGMATEVIDQNPEPPKLKDVKKEVKKHKLKLASCFLCKSKKKGKKDHETQSEVKEKEEVVVAVETNVQDEAKVIDPKLFQGLDRAVDQPLLCFDVPSVIDLPKITTTREAAGPEEKKKKTEKNKKEDDDLSWEMVRHEDVEDAPPLPLEEEKKEEQEEVKQEVEQPKVEEIKLKTIEVKEEPIIELDLPILDIITVDVKKTTAEEEEESRRGGKPSDDPVVLPDLNDRLLIQLPQLAEGKLSELPDPNKQELAQPVQTKFSLASCFKCQCAGSKGSKVKKNNKKKELALSPTSAHAAAEVKEEEKKEEEQKQETVDTTPVDLTWSVGLDRKEGEFVVRREPEPVQTQVIDLPSIVDVVVEQQQNEEETLSSAPAAAEITEKKEETAPEVVQKAPVESKVLQPEVKELDVEKIKEVDLIGARIVLDREPDHAYIPIVTSTTPNPVVVATEQQLESVPQETEKNVVEDKLKKTEKKKKRKFNLNMPLINCLNPKYRKQKKEKKDLAATPAENLPLVEDEIKQEEPLETKVKEEDFVVDARWSQGLDRSQDQPLINKEPIVEISLTESPPPKEEIKKEEEEIKVEAKKEEEMKQLERQPQEEMKQEIDLDIKQVNLEEGQHIVLDCEPDNVTLPDSTNRETVPQVLYVEERLAVANEQSPVEKKQKRKRSSKTSCIDMPLLKCLVPRNEEHKTKKKDIKKKTTKNAAKDETVETPAVAAEASPEAKEENTVEVRKVFTNLVDMPVVELIVPKLVDKEEDEKKKEEKIKKLEEEILPSAETEVATSVCPAFDDAKNKRIKRKEKKEEEERVEESKTATTAATEATTIVEHIKLDRRPDPVVLPDLNQRQAQVLVKETVKEEEHPLAAEAELTKTDEQKKKKKKKERRTLLIDMPIINILIPKEKKHKLKEMKGKTPAEVTAPFVAEDLAPAETTPVSVVDTSWSVGLDRKENELLVRRVEDDVVKRVEEPKPIEVAASEATLDIPILDIVFVQKLEQNLKKSTHTLPPPTQGKESKKSFWTKCILCKGSKKNKEETASLPDKKTKKQKKQILEMEQVPVSPPTEVEAATIVIKPYDAATEQQPEQKAAIDMFSMMSNLDAPYVEKKEETEKKTKKGKEKERKNPNGGRSRGGSGSCHSSFC